MKAKQVHTQDNAEYLCMNGWRSGVHTTASFASLETEVFILAKRFFWHTVQPFLGNPSSAQSLKQKAPPCQETLATGQVLKVFRIPVDSAFCVNLTYFTELHEKNPWTRFCERFFFFSFLRIFAFVQFWVLRENQTNCFYQEAKTFKTTCAGQLSLGFPNCIVQSSKK